MMNIIGVVLAKIADAVLSAVVGQATAEIATRLLAPDATRIFRQALAQGLQSYAAGTTRTVLIEPLTRQASILAEPKIAAEIARLLTFDREPDYELIGNRWKEALEQPQPYRNYTHEARELLRHITGCLKNSEIYRPIFELKSLDAIAEQSQATQQTLASIDRSLNAYLHLLSVDVQPLLQKFASSATAIQDGITDFSLEISRKSEDFAGRQWVIDALEHFINTHAQGYFFVKGEPGIGKSAISAYLVKTQACVHHFNIRSVGINTSRAFLHNVCCQLIANYDLEYQDLPAHAVEDGRFLIKILNAISAKQQPGSYCLIVVDALDEVRRDATAVGTNLLYLPERLPPGIFIVVTMRNTPHIQPRVEVDSEELLIDSQSTDNMQDINTYLRQYIEQHGLAQHLLNSKIHDTFIDELSRKSEGNFMYLRYVLPELHGNELSLTALTQLPYGLRNYYKRHWEVMKGADLEAWFTYKLPILEVLAIVYTPISVDLIMKYARVSERSRAVQVLNEWHEFLDVQRAIYGSTALMQYCIYHESFFDFLQQQQEIAAERVNLEQRRREMVATMNGILDA